MGEEKRDGDNPFLSFVAKGNNKDLDEEEECMIRRNGGEILDGPSESGQGVRAEGSKMGKVRAKAFGMDRDLFRKE